MFVWNAWLRGSHPLRLCSGQASIRGLSPVGRYPSASSGRGSGCFLEAGREQMQSPQPGSMLNLEPTDSQATLVASTVEAAFKGEASSSGEDRRLDPPAGH